MCMTLPRSSGICRSGWIATPWITSAHDPGGGGKELLRVGQGLRRLSLRENVSGRAGGEPVGVARGHVILVEPLGSLAQAGELGGPIQERLQQLEQGMTEDQALAPEISERLQRLLSRLLAQEAALRRVTLAHADLGKRQVAPRLREPPLGFSSRLDRKSTRLN